MVADGRGLADGRTESALGWNMADQRLKTWLCDAQRLPTAVSASITSAEMAAAVPRKRVKELIQ
jgi:hypothetical protein